VQCNTVLYSAQWYCVKTAPVLPLSCSAPVRLTYVLSYKGLLDIISFLTIVTFM